MRALRNQGGWMMPTSITLLAIMMTVSLATFSFVDTGQERTREQRERESSLNLSEGVLYAQGFKLAQGWPGALDGPSTGTGVDPVIPPAVCTETTGATAGCPNPAQLSASQGGATANFNTIDQLVGATWVTRVRDNGGPLAQSYVTAGAAYDQPQTGTKLVLGAPTAYTCTAPCTWDANGDKQLWVQSRSIVRGKPRNLVALLRLETVREGVPETALTAGGVNVSNNGNKTMIYAEGSQVVVRCNPSVSTCASWVSSPVAQIVPAPVTGNPPNFLTTQQLARFKARAISDGRYYATCPTDNNLWGAVVWIESCHTAAYANSTITVPCSPTAPPVPNSGGGNQLPDDCVNQRDEPGMVINHCGGFKMSGGWTYVGIVYSANNSDGTCVGQTGQRGGSCNLTAAAGEENTLADISGGVGVWGAVAIDGPGCLRTGSNSIQIQFDPNVFNAATSYGTVGLVQNTWRELPPN